MINKTLFFIFQAFNIAIFALFADGVQPASLAVSGMVSFFLYGSLIYRGLLTTRWVPSPVILFMATSLIRLGVAPIYVAAVYVKGFRAEMFFVTFDPHDYIGQGYLLLMIGELCFLAGYFYMEHRLSRRTITPPVQALSGPRWLFRAGVWLIALAWILRIFFGLGIDFKAIGNLFSIFRAYSGPAGIFFLLLSQHLLTGIKKQMAITAILIFLGAEFIYSLQSYMKVETILVLIPLVAYFIGQIDISSVRRNLGLKHFLPIALVAYFVVMVLFPYSQARRPEFWHGKTFNDNVAVAPYLMKALQGSVPGTRAFSKNHEFPNTGMWTFIARNQWISAASWSVHQVETKGTISGKTILYGFVSIIPRIFWPNKPIISQGRDFAVALGQARSFETATTSTGLGLAATFYWNGGALLVMAGMLAGGMLLRICWRVFGSRALSNPVAMVAIILMWSNSASHFAGSFDGGITFYAYIFIVFYPLTLVFQKLGNANRRTHRAAAAVAPS